jgi:hypothetical protein
LDDDDGSGRDLMSEAEDIAAFVADQLREVNTALPGRIESYNANTGKAEVQPLLKERYADGDVITLPRIPNVPLVFPRTQAASISMPVAAGDGVLLLFCQRSLDKWLSTGGIKEPDDIRMHSLSDCIAIPGLVPFSTGGPGFTNLVIQRGGAQFKIDASSRIAFGTSAVELLDEVTKAFDEIATLSTAWGASTTQVQASSAAIKTIQGSI